MRFKKQFILMLISSSVITQGQEDSSPGTAENALVALSEFVVNAEGDRGYSVANTIGSTRTNTRLVDIAQTVSVATGEFMEDVGVINMIEALKYLPGVNQQVDQDRFLIRGRSALGAFTDGIPDFVQSSSGVIPFQYERIEILKGPSAIVYGSHSPGGIINRVRKIPSFQPRHLVSATLGNESHYQADVDSTGPLSENLAYRLIGSLLDRKGENPFDYRRRWGVFPMLTFVPTDRTTLRFVAEYFSDVGWYPKLNHFLLRDANGRFSSESPFSDTVLPREFSTAEPISFHDDEKILARFAWEQSISESLKLNWVINARWWDHYRPEMVGRGAQSNNQFVNRLWRVIHRNNFQFVTALDAVWNFEAGPTKHKVLSILQYVDTDNREDRLGVAGGVTPSLEFANPVYGFDGFDHNPTVTRDLQSTGNNFSISLQDEMRFWEDRAILVGGVRYDDFETGGFDHRTGTEIDPGTGDHVSFKFGAIGKWQENSSIYYNFSETFEPDFSRNPDGAGFKPQVGKIHEVGIKGSLLEAKINLGVAAYTQVIENIKALHPDPLLAEQGFRVQSEEQTVDGIEIEAHLNPTDNWRLYFSSAWISVTHPDDLIQRTQPKETYAFFTRYAFENDSPLSGLQIGGGVHYSGGRPGDSGNSFFLPSFWSADVVFRYRLNPNTVFTLNVNNVTDERFINRSINRNQLLNNLPRSIRFKVTYTW